MTSADLYNVELGLLLSKHGYDNMRYANQVCTFLEEAVGLEVIACKQILPVPSKSNEEDYLSGFLLLTTYRTTRHHDVGL